MSKSQLSLFGGILAVVLFFALNIAANATLRTIRLDLTEDKIFTLDEGSKSIAKGIDEPINLYFYLSRKQAREYPEILEYADRVLGMLREYERASDGNIRLQVIDPEPFSEEEDSAVERGIQGAPLPTGEVLYFGLVGTSATDDQEVIPFFSPDARKQGEVEYDLSKLIWTLTHPDKRKIGILSALPLGGGGGNPMLGQQQSPPWQFIEQLGAFFEVEMLPQTPDALDDIDALLVIHPRGFNDATLWLIDQWALAGKPLVVYVDPQCDVDPGASSDPSNPMSRFTADKSSNLDKLFVGWGIELSQGKVACDRQLGMRQPVPSPDGRSSTEIPVVFLLQAGEDEASRDDPATRLLKNLLFLTPGSLRAIPEATTTFTPLVQTTEESQEVDSALFQFRPDAQKLLASFVPGYQRLTLAARVTGDATSAFPEGEPGAAPSPSFDEDGNVMEASEGADAAAGLRTSSAPLNLVVFADADMLNDRLWMQSLGRIGNQMLIQQISENVDLLRNVVESVLGGKELMGIRVRGNTSRPFEIVQDIQREADQRNLARKQELERKLQDAERRLRELQQAQGEGAEELITAEQRREEENVRQEFVQTRRDLRDVQHQLRKDIESLGTSLKWLNIALMPALVCALALALSAWRTQQRNRS